MRLLMVEDEIKTGDYLQQGLTEVGFMVPLSRNGFDDYLVKPFAFAELLACVRTLLRRTNAPVLTDQIKVADLTLDLPRHRATGPHGQVARSATVTRSFAYWSCLSAGKAMSYPDLWSRI